MTSGVSAENFLHSLEVPRVAFLWSLYCSWAALHSFRWSNSRSAFLDSGPEYCSAAVQDWPMPHWTLEVIDLVEALLPPLVSRIEASKP